MSQPYENWFQVDRHANGGFIVLIMVDENGQRFNLGPIEVPTVNIPVDLRKIGSRFKMTWGNIDGETADEIRESRASAFQVVARWPPE